MGLRVSIQVLVSLVFILALIEKGKSELTILNELESLFNLNAEEYVQFESEEHGRVKRADVSQIRHLYDEARVNPHSQAEKDAILAKHREYRSSTTPEASNMEYMVCINKFIPEIYKSSLKVFKSTYVTVILRKNIVYFGTGL